MYIAWLQSIRIRRRLKSHSSNTHTHTLLFPFSLFQLYSSLPIILQKSHSWCMGQMYQGSLCNQDILTRFNRYRSSQCDWYLLFFSLSLFPFRNLYSLWTTTTKKKTKADRPPTYPTSSAKGPKDWDKLNQEEKKVWSSFSLSLSSLSLSFCLFLLTQSFIEPSY